MRFVPVCGFATKVVCLLLVASVLAHTQRCGVGAERQASAESLRQAGIAVLNAIQQKNSEALFRYVEPGGIVFGPDKAPISRIKLQNQFARKQGAYCLFFSAQCIAKMGRFKGLELYPALSQWKISYSDWLEANKTYSVSADLTDDAGIDWCNGEVYAETQEQMKNAPDNIELDFSLYKGRWWLVATVETVP